MKITNIEKATEVIAEWKTATTNLRQALDSTEFRIHFGMRSSSLNFLIGPVSMHQSMYSGQLASDIHGSLIRYYEGILGLIEAQMKELDIEVPERPKQ